MDEAFGIAAYQAYCDAVGGKSAISGDPLPAWEDQSDKIRNAWIAGALAALKHFRTVNMLSPGAYTLPE